VSLKTIIGMICCIDMVKVNAMHKSFVIHQHMFIALPIIGFGFNYYINFVLEFATNIVANNVACNL
jgi:hypothetical protein